LLHDETTNKAVTELIIGVAIKQGDLMVCLPKPNRHHHCIRYAVQTLGLTARPIAAGHGLQGFYTDDGKYLTRQDAMIYAKANGQLINQNPTKDLFSEDLW
jgi:hypothetical protein